jgi:protein ImuB
MVDRRILSLWFPRLAAERVLRHGRSLPCGPLAVVAEVRNAQVIASLSAEAEAAGLYLGQGLRDARAMCPALITRTAAPGAEAAFLAHLRRWAGKFSPLVATEGADALLIDITGCAHLFGGEAPMLAEAEADCANLGLTVRAGLADTPGAAWALARFAGRAAVSTRSGDAIAQEARATRARAATRRGGAPLPAATPARIAPPGHTRTALAPLPVAALRLDHDVVAGLARLGLRRIGDLAGMPRAALARRFGRAVMLRLDQAFGATPEPISPAREAPAFAVRLSFPEPIGLRDDIAAAIDRMLPRLAARLTAAGRGARHLRLEAFRADGGIAEIGVGLARPSADPDRLRPLLALKLDQIDAGLGIDRLRLVAVQTEPVHPHQHHGHAEATARALARQADDTALDDMIGRIGARLGMEAITRLAPGDSHIPEKSAQVLAAAYAPAAPGDWPAPPGPRPALLFRPEPVQAPETPTVPATFRWRRTLHKITGATGPERIAPEWWLDDPEWRSGVRDYWRLETETGARLWLFYAHGATMSGGWFCHGIFA